MSRPSLRALVQSFIGLPLMSVLAGCALQQTATSPIAATGNVTGRIMGGQQPVTGASVGVYMLGTSYGTGQQLLASTTTDANGNFSIDRSTYDCSASKAPLVIVSRGGNPGLAPGTNNSAIYLAAMLDFCANVTSATRININEITTVATAYAMSGFVNQTNYSNFGVPVSNAYGPGIALRVYSRLVDNPTGSTPGTSLPPGMSVPSLKITSLANSIAACINSASQSSTGCSSLFSYTGIATTGAFANTFAAVGSIVQHPTTHVDDIYNLAGPTPPFGNVLPFSPQDWSMPIVHSDGKLNSSATHLAIDPFGRVWVVSNTGNNTLEAIDAGGSHYIANAGSAELTTVGGIAIETDGSVVVTNVDAASPAIRRYSPFDGQLAKSVTDASIIGRPFGIIINSDDRWLFTDITNNRVTLLNQNTLTYSTTADANGPHTPYLVGQGDVYVGNLNGLAHTQIVGGPPGMAYTTSTDQNCRWTSDPTYWYCFTDAHKTTYYGLQTPAPGAVTAQQQIAGFFGGIASTGGMMDGLGQLWEANSDNTNAFVAARFTNLQGAVAMTAEGNLLTSGHSYSDLAIDGAGNVWLTSNQVGGVTELVGAAAPTITPTTTAVRSNRSGVRP